MGRSYVRLDRRPSGAQGYEAWVLGLRSGRLYCEDGRSHFLESTVNRCAGGDFDVELAAPGEIKIEGVVAARLKVEIIPETEAIRKQNTQTDHWGWHLEQARIGNTREVAVKLVVNGIAVDKKTIVADKPIRASKRSAQWCRTCVDKIWELKSPFIGKSERPAAATAFDHARKVYDVIIGQCEVA